MTSKRASSRKNTTTRVSRSPTRPVRSKTLSNEQLKKQAAGHAADAKGLRFEQTVGNYYGKRWGSIQYRFKLLGREFDLYSYNENDDTHLLVECKDKARVTPGDVLSFLAKLQKVNSRRPHREIAAVLAYTGELPKDARNAAKSSDIPVRFKKF